MKKTCFLRKKKKNTGIRVKFDKKRRKRERKKFQSDEKVWIDGGSNKWWANHENLGIF